MLFTPDERRALLVVAGLLTLGLVARLATHGEVPPEGGGDSLLVVLAAQPAPADTATAGVPPGLLEEGRLRINEASRADLECLPRIGPALAARILEERDRNGPFHSAEDLTRVRGIGQKTARSLAPYLSFRVGR